MEAQVDEEVVEELDVEEYVVVESTVRLEVEKEVASGSGLYLHSYRTHH